MTGKKLKVLITGAAGRVGTAFWENADERFELYLSDIDTGKLEKTGHQIIKLDILDAKSCKEACIGMDVILHLAGNPLPDASFNSLLGINIQGTNNIFEAAKASNCSRIVFASSAQAIEGYPLDVQVTPQMPVRPKNLYGVSKCFGEALASYYAYQQDLSCIAVRIACFEEFELKKKETARDISAYLSKRDLVQLLTKCIQAPVDVKFAIVHGVSDNRFKRLDLTSTKQILDYTPLDNAFDILEYSLTD